MSFPLIPDKPKSDTKTIENFHCEMRRQFAAYYVKPKPNFRELQARERQEAIARIKNILFARLLVRLIKNYSATGNDEPLEINWQTLAEAL